MKPYLDLTGRVALVTGASSGIGQATAETLADLGAAVALGYHRNRDGAEAARDRIVAAGGTAIAVGADVQRSEEVRALVDRVTSDLGPIDILVNNAGSLIARASLLEMTEERINAILALNFTSAVLVTQAVMPSMIARRRGAIINVASIAGHTGGGPGATVYASSKAALASFTKGLARDLAPQGIRVNAISPGVIDTPFHEMFSTPEMLQNFVKSIPIGRVGSAAECATVIAFLASDAASYIVGESIEVNGGQLMR